MNLDVNFVCRDLGVSQATIRNWIKSGELQADSEGLINLENYAYFKENKLGKERLNKRANKQHLDTKCANFEKLISQISVSELSDRYEESLGRSYRNKEGIYYTPIAIVEDMLSKIDIRPDMNFCDPCCGSGNFLIEAFKKGVKPENIYGYDIDPIAVMIAKARFKELTGFDNPNIKVNNFLHDFVKKNSQLKFDIIATNPPWGKKESPEDKKLFSDIIGRGKIRDSSVYFTVASINSLKDGGCLALLLPEAYFNIQSYQLARDLVLARDLLALMDYGKAFDGLQTRARAFVLKNKVVKSSDVRIFKDNMELSINSSSFKTLPFSIISFEMDSMDSEVINHLFNLKYKTLTGCAKWALGIVTGNNKKFVLKNRTVNTIDVYKGADITSSGLKDPTSFLRGSFDNFQQVAPLSIYNSKEKVVYKFISSNLKFFNDKKQRYFLNSANMFVLTDGFDLSHDELCFVLNTSLYNWIYKKVFSAHKVLKSDIEKLPIFTDYIVKHRGSLNEQDFYKYLNVEEYPDGSFRIKE